MDYGSRHGSALPSIDILERNQTNRADQEAHARHHSTSSAEMRSSTTTSYSGPPPSSSNPQSTSVRNVPGPLSPASARRQSEERDRYPVQKLSLPSIHEALGTSQPTPQPTYSTQSYQPPPPPLPPPPIQQYSSHPPNSPRNLSRALDRETYGTSALPPQHQLPPAAPAPHTSVPPYLARATTPPSLTSARSRGPSLHPITTSDPPKLHDSRPAHWGANHNRAVDQIVPGLPSANPEHYTQPYPPTTYPLTPASQYDPESYRHTSSTRARDGRDYDVGNNTKVDSVGSNIGDSVKRHLEVFDLEASLDEISDSSKQLYDFSGYYAQRAHETQRSGPLPGSTPHLSEIDKMIRQGVRIQESLGKLREVVVTQQAELHERSKEQMPKQLNGHVSGPPPQQDPMGSGGFAGADPKKRRGRAAPPGNCHSCNRSETPEWRRGPDGARTLCNACGLHYAKLTRKMGANKAGTTGSNLRPKDTHSGL